MSSATIAGLILIGSKDRPQPPSAAPAVVAQPVITETAVPPLAEPAPSQPGISLNELPSAAPKTVKSVARAQATITIENDDDLPAITIDDVTVTQGPTKSTNAIFHVSLSKPSGKACRPAKPSTRAVSSGSARL